jgi:hypothetical protein
VLRGAAEAPGAGLVQHVTVPRQPDGRRQHLGQRERPEAVLCLGEPCHASGHAGGQMADHALVGEVAGGVEVHVAGGAARGGLAVVQGLHRAVGKADHHEPPAPDVAGRRVHHREREAHRHRRVNGVAAAVQDLRSHLAGNGMHR